MALYIYESTGDPASAFSTEGNMSNPIRFALDGRSGGSQEQRYWLRNDNGAKTYTDIQIHPVSLGGRNIVDGIDGYSWKLRVGNTQPTASEWSAITAGVAIDFDDISDTDYHAFWLKIEIPAGAEVTSYDQATLRITATET